MAQSLSNEVYNFLLKKILSNELSPGELINRRTIAEAMGVSVAPVLEAMLFLEFEGFLETKPRKGTQVRLLKEKEIVEQLIVREAIECQAARMYCGHPITVNLERLMELAKKVDESSKSTLVDWELEIDFHRELLHLTGCQMLVKEFDRVMKLYLFYSLNRLLPNAESIQRDDHKRLVDNLQTPDKDKAEKYMRNHLIVGKEYIFGIKPE